ncbi:MAG TPA: hypothetical protein VMF58_17390 [Rhizomicrobium sp.]|nr:hypothetical protein [Rhizomicrobium sp.]
MLEYENVAYIDLQKTGSSTIKYVLSNLLAEDEVTRSSHRGIYEDFDRSKPCFISVREPLSLYISLFSFGAGSKRGGLYRTLCRRGREDLFAPTREAFELWLDFMLDPQNAELLKSGYGSAGNAEIGFLSYRLLFICVPNAQKRMQKKRFHERDEIRALFARHLYKDYVRLENLAGDLFSFLSLHSARLRFREPLTTADRLMADIPKRNASPKIAGLSVDTVSPELRERVRDREWLFYEAFGYDTDPKGRPPGSITGERPQEAKPSGPKRRERRRERRAARQTESSQT